MPHSIYHANTRETRFEETPLGERINFERDWVKVCEIDIPYNLNNIFAACNQSPWLEGEDGSYLAWFDQDFITLEPGIDRARSLSVGDIIVRDGSDVLVQVARIGFKVVLAK